MYRFKFIKPIALLCGLVALSATHLTLAKPQHSDQAKPDKPYFRHIMFRESPYATYRGIHPVVSQENPDVAHYEFEYDEQGRVDSISYQINERLIRRNGVWDSFIWFAPKVNIDYQDNKEIHTYYNADGKQITAHGNVYQAQYQLDPEGRRQTLVFFDEAGNKSESAWNIHRYEWQHKNGKVYEKRFNLAGEQQFLRPDLQFHEIELEYDDDGKLSFMRNLGLTGTPANNETGAGIDRIVYDHNGNFVRWQVYDKDANPIEGNEPGVHIGEHLYDQYGNKVGFRGFDRHGNQVPFSWGTYEDVQLYNTDGNQTDRITYNADGSLAAHLSFEYSDDKTEFVWIKSLNEDHNLIASPMLGGAAALKFDYQDDGSVKRQFFNADMSTYVPPARPR